MGCASVRHAAEAQNLGPKRPEINPREMEWEMDLRPAERDRAQGHPGY